ncbi:ATP-binding cassette domain-containing protein [Archaeoglobus profundus]|uniref:Molybdate/tungstate import ATP-binding protein WtpC n=1 Tax=Archaeoglobus profundus (strain DSM 5631 / JCM 9629 / NBRC 100127 / Av18) TaxID=572546 RepID=D2RFG2_ARCPA|nr:ATP-binding cassette domain-containing protein [Archaeoglobus profundus]ADB58856.1 ABC transporter related protein [Archaeoglobus profundus DSM 5631]
MLRLENVSKDWKEFKIRDVSFEVKRKEYFVLLGHSGAGKTLLLEIIAGLHKPDSGRIYLEGEDVTGKPPEKRNVAYMPQNYALFPHLSVYDNIAYGLKIRKFEKNEIRRKVLELSEVLGISHLLHRKPNTLSGGEQQRVALARALAIEPKLLLLDEPFSNLDLATRFRLVEEMKRWHKELGFTAIHVTHSFDEAMALGDRVGIMIKGRVEQVGRCEDVFSKPKSVEIAEFLGYNVIRGFLRDGKLYLNGLKLNIESDFEGDVSVVIKPEDVLISKDGEFEALVEGVEFFKFLAVVTLNVNGLKIKAQTTTENVLKESIRVGSKVRVSIRSLRLMV